MPERVTPVVIEAVDAAEADTVFAVTQEAFRARAPLDPPADALGDTVSALAERLHRGRGLLARLDGEPVGALLLDPEDEVVWLRRVGVLPRVQHLGVARALVEAAAEAAWGFARLAVLVREETPGPQQFWAAQGFSRVGERSPYLIYERALPDELVARDADAMRAAGVRLGRLLQAADLVVLNGDLGAGKTTLTQGLGTGLGVRGEVTSPTFVIARVHPSLIDGPCLVHVDAYRLGGGAELDDLDLDTNFDEAVTVVEWGAGIAETLSERRLELHLSRAVGEVTSPPGDEDDVEDPRTLRWVRTA